MRRSKVDDYDVVATKRRRLVEITPADCAAATPENPAFHRACRRCTKALGVRVEKTRVYLLTASRKQRRYIRPPGDLTKPGQYWLEASPSRAKPKAAPAVPQAEAPPTVTPEEHPNVVQLHRDGMPGAKQTAMPLTPPPERTHRDCALEVVRKHQDALLGSRERIFLDVIMDLEHLTSAQAKWLRDICVRAGVVLWHGGAA